jgi:hypothetical protein
MRPWRGCEFRWTSLRWWGLPRGLVRSGWLPTEVRRVRGVLGAQQACFIRLGPTSVQIMPVGVPLVEVWCEETLPEVWGLWQQHLPGT